MFWENVKKFNEKAFIEGREPIQWLSWEEFWTHVDTERAKSGLAPLWDELKDKWIERLSKLNPSQFKAVTTVQAAVQITSVAGSGKTTVMVNRIGFMVECLGIHPSAILATTFTKKAAEEIKERLSKIISPAAISHITMGTTHSIAYRILAREYKETKHHLAAVFTKGKGESGKAKGDIVGELVMGWKQRKLVQDCKNALLKSSGLDDEQRQRLERTKIPQFLRVIGLAKNEGIDAIEFTNRHATNPLMAHYIDMYQAYENKKWECQCMDLDDLIFNLVNLFESNRKSLESYQAQYQYIMVDETQDNNLLQYKLAIMLAYPKMHLQIVGDDDQSMYRFRGAKPEMFIKFNEFMNLYLKQLGYNKEVELTQIPLENNYRSMPDILNRANMLIENNTFRIPKRLIPHKQGDDKVVSFKEYYDEQEEAAGVVEEVELLNDKNGIELKDQVILYRTNAQCVAFENELISRGISYVIHGGMSFYERKEVKTIVNYLKLAVNPNDNLAFLYVYNTPQFEDKNDSRNRFLGQEFLNAVKATKKKYYIGMELVKHEKHWVLENWKKGVSKLKEAIEGLRLIVNDESKSPEEAIDYLLEEVGFRDYFTEQDDEESDDEDNTQLANIETLKHAMSRFDDIHEFLDYIDQMTSKRKEDINGVQLMTIHKSKGLEFKAVFAVGMSEGLLPHYKVIEEGDLAVESERNLAYVAVTRGEQLVNISSVQYFNGKGYGISRFVEEMGLTEDQWEGDIDPDGEQNLPVDSATDAVM